MHLVKAALIYLALGVGATGAGADPLGLTGLREGSMKKLVVHAEPRAVADTAFKTEAGPDATLADYRGKVLLVNFWATWCAPCRKEMPMLAALQDELGGDAFEVLTIATGRNAPPAMKKFLDDIGATNLPRHTDARQQLARAMGVLGLPVTVLIDTEGREVARLTGDADWASDSARAIVEHLIAATSGL